MKILGIETSCDETAVCLIEASESFGSNFQFKIFGNALASQAALHAQYGGVFPNLAKREHIKNLPILLEQVMKETGLDPNKPDIDVIAVTVGPGLEPCLWTGITFVQQLVVQWGVPVVAVNHMEGHVVIAMLRREVDSEQLAVGSNYQLTTINFPVLSLLISGGHTELVLSKEFGHYQVVGQTRDDAAGEAFDKVARLLGLPYPGGPEISRLAAQARSSQLAAPFKLPRPMMHEDNFDFSFSGLKTAVRRIVEATPQTDLLKMQVSCEFENAVADVLVKKTLRAVDQFGAQTVLVGGGVSANTEIRRRLAEALAEAGGVSLLTPPIDLATDNAIMIALAGYFHAQKKEFADPTELVASGNLALH